MGAVEAVGDQCPNSGPPAGAGVLTGHTGRGVPGLMVTGVVRKRRPAVVPAGRRDAVGV